MIALALKRSMNAAALAAEVVGEARLEAADGNARRAAHRRALRLRRSCARGVTLLNLSLVNWGRLPSAPCIIVANHVSWLDALVVGALTPTVPIATAEVRRWPLVGPLCSSLGALFVECGSAASGAQVLRRARAALDDGVSVLGFPEGTTSRPGEGLLPFHRGLFGLAAIADVPVVPVALRYGDDVHWTGDPGVIGPWFSVARKRTLRVEIHIGSPMRPGPRQPLGGFVDQVRQQMTTMLAPPPLVTRFAA